LFKGLSDFIFDDQRDSERIIEMPCCFDLRKNQNNETSDQNAEINLSSKASQERVERAYLNCEKETTFCLMSNQSATECFIIDKHVYIRNIFSFSSDKTLINSYLDSLVNFYNCL
jgi:hypothetical protein